MTASSDSQRNLSCSDIDLVYIFKNLEDQIYTLIKGETELIPTYIPGSDFDFFCYHFETFGKKLLSLLSTYVNNGFRIRIQDIEQYHTHVDILDKEKLHLRFDLYGSMPNYPGVTIRRAFFYSVIENSVPLEKKYGNSTFRIWIPSEVDGLLVRYIEYAAFYEQRPDKIKHLEYILSCIHEKQARIGFLDKLHAYTDLPKCAAYTPTSTLYPRRTFTEKTKRLIIKSMNLFLPEKRVMNIRLRYSSLKKNIFPKKKKG